MPHTQFDIKVFNFVGPPLPDISFIVFVAHAQAHNVHWTVIEKPSFTHGFLIHKYLFRDINAYLDID